MNARTVGTCFGFAVRSSLPFHYLRSGDGEPLDVSADTSTSRHVSAQSLTSHDGYGELILDEAPPAFPLEVRLYRDGSSFRLWVGDSGWSFIDTDTRSVTLPHDANVVRREERLWSMPAILFILARGDFSLHAAAVEVDGEALVVGAPNTFGKTTLGAGFLAAGYRLLSEDITCVRTSSIPLVIPGPALLRVRRDIAERFAITKAKPLREVRGRVHFAVDPAFRGDCTPLPLRAIVLLRESRDGLRLEPVRAVDALRDLWQLSIRLPTQLDRARCFSQLVDLAQSVPIWNLYRPLRVEELPATVAFLAENV